jgi:hypothetical protein
MRSQYLGLSSITHAEIPKCSAAIRVVPDPANQSTTSSPVTAEFVSAYLPSCSGFIAGLRPAHAKTGIRLGFRMTSLVRALIVVPRSATELSANGACGTFLNRLTDSSLVRMGEWSLGKRGYSY